MNIIEASGSPPPYPAKVSALCKDFLDHCFIRDWRERPFADELLLHPFVKGNDGIFTFQKTRLRRCLRVKMHKECSRATCPLEVQ